MDFPAFINDLKQFGITGYETFVSDGHTDYYGKSDFKTATVAKCDPIEIAGASNDEQFSMDLKAHQQRQTRQ